VRRAVQLPAAALVLALAGTPAGAALAPGTTAPPFTAEASLGGTTFEFDLRRALAKGPVVLYFYPAAFTKSCTLEAHDFAEHIGNYRALGATVIGVSVDDIATLTKFSVSACRRKFAVASDQSHAISKAYDALLARGSVRHSNRTSYVIAPDGRIVYSYTSRDPSRHVANTLGALRKLRERERHSPAVRVR
jgi:thioredoxin-dependent peroxiredoxin